MCFLKLKKYSLILYYNVAVKLLATIYIAFISKFICEANNNLFPVVVCDCTTPSSGDPTVNAEFGCMLFAAIKINI